MPPRNRGLNKLRWREKKKTDPMLEQFEVEEAKETKDGEDTNEEKDRIYAELLSKPPHGSEVFMGDIPPDATEEELKEFCKDAGEVVEVRIVRKNDDTKVCALVSFRTVEMASEAIKELHNTEFKGKKVRCSMSNSSNTILIRNIPRQWKESELKNAVDQVCPGVTRVDLMRDSITGMGYAYVEYHNHACADYSLKKRLSELDFKHDSNSPTFKMADHKCLKVKEVYVENLPKDVTYEQIKELFKRHGGIEKVVLLPPRAGYETKTAFVCFNERANAMKALKNTEPYELNGGVLVCRLANPLEDKKPETRNPSQSGYGARGVYVNGLPKDVTEEKIKELFERHGDIEKVVLPLNKAGYEKRYAFVYFKEANAMKAIQNTEHYELNGAVLNCSLAKNDYYGAKGLYVNGLPKDVTKKKIKELFERNGDIEKVVIPPPKAGYEKRYAFVYFKEANAIKAIQNAEPYELDGDVLYCSLAKNNDYGVAASSWLSSEQKQ